MASVRSKDTGAERQLRSLLHREGFRYRLHRQDLPGTPDVYFPRQRVAIFVHGCFWHRHLGCPRATLPRTNQTYWEAKFRRNLERDAEAQAQLVELGILPLIVWECRLKSEPLLVLRDVSSVLQERAVLGTQ